MPSTASSNCGRAANSCSLRRIGQVWSVSGVQGEQEPESGLPASALGHELLGKLPETLCPLMGAVDRDPGIAQAC